MSESDFERRLATLLRQTAADIPPELDVLERVHPQVLNGDQHGDRRWLAMASMTAVVALLIGTFTWFHGDGARTGLPSGAPTAAPTSTPASTGQIALHVDTAYADATTTAITFHITGPQADTVYIPAAHYLTDAAGSSLHNLTEQGLSPPHAAGLEPER